MSRAVREMFGMSEDSAESRVADQAHFSPASEPVPDRSRGRAEKGHQHSRGVTADKLECRRSLRSGAVSPIPA